MAKQIEAIQEIEYPDEFYQQIRHVSSFANIELYNVYLKEQKIKWDEKQR